MLSRLCSGLIKYPHVKSGFVKTLSTRTEFTHLTEENVVKGNRKLEYPVKDCFTFLSKRFEQFGDNVAVVRMCYYRYYFITHRSIICEDLRNLRDSKKN